jgi:hypothetical protein
MPHQAQAGAMGFCSTNVGALRCVKSTGCCFPLSLIWPLRAFASTAPVSTTALIYTASTALAARSYHENSNPNRIGSSAIEIRSCTFRRESHGLMRSARSLLRMPCGGRTKQLLGS